MAEIRYSSTINSFDNKINIIINAKGKEKGSSFIEYEPEGITLDIKEINNDIEQGMATFEFIPPNVGTYAIPFMIYDSTSQNAIKYTIVINVLSKVGCYSSLMR